MISRFFQNLARMMEVYRSRRSLAQLSREQLRDIGVTPGQANIEANRQPWDSRHFPGAWTPGRQLAQPHILRR